MDWIKPFYTRKSEWVGPTGIFDRHRDRAASIERLHGPGKQRILELGAGAGGTAAALADLGHDVVAVELSPVRAQFARELARQPRQGTLTVLEADYFTVELEGRFDVVGHWDSFGMGSDDDQRRLLLRVAEVWLAPDGCMLLDVFNPFWWAHHAGEEYQHNASDMQTVEMPNLPLRQRRAFDPVGCRFIDTWWVEGDEEHAITQNVRCYTPADLRLLLEGTGLVIERMEIEGEVVDPVATMSQMARWREDVESYLVKLVRNG